MHICKPKIWNLHDCNVHYVKCLWFSSLTARQFLPQFLIAISAIVPNDDSFDFVLWLGDTADTLKIYITSCQESNSTTGNRNLPQNNGRSISLVYAKLLKLTRECCTFPLCRYTLSDYYTMLSWICIPAIGKEYYWEPSCWHPRSGMTRQVREISDERF